MMNTVQMGLETNEQSSGNFTGSDHAVVVVAAQAPFGQ
jgi:hypothetical protein